VDIAASALPPTAAALVTGAVARSLLSPVRAQLRSKPEVIGEILTDAFRQTRLASSDHLRALNWARAGAVDDSLLGGMTDASLKMLVQGLYVAACDALGPVAADRLLAQSIARAQSLPAAVELAVVTAPPSAIKLLQSAPAPVLSGNASAMWTDVASFISGLPEPVRRAARTHSVAGSPSRVILGPVIATVLTAS
jgi:hypothetical protein